MKEETKWQRIGDLEWSRYFDKMNWYDAKKKCEEMGCRLPTRAELVDLVDNHPEEIKDWDKDYNFWSSTEGYPRVAHAWRVTLHNGYTTNSTKTNLFYVRCVRR